MPSKWDENQARVITDIRQEAGSFDCKADIPTQLNIIEKNIEWFNYYSDFKDTSDLKEMMSKLQTTVTEFSTTASKGPASPTYCQLKKMIIVSQAGIIGSTIKGSL
jgi:hypothetical protein